MFGILVTYRRPDQLARTLEALANQSRPLTHLVVVDNAPTRRNEELVGTVPAADYLAAPENLGPAGGIALGMEHMLGRVDDSGWITTLDDDDPPIDPTLFATLFAFASELAEKDQMLGGVGLSGVRFDRHRGRIVRVPDDELCGAVPVDAIAGNQFPLYAARAVRAAGPFRRDLFFGFEELEYGLRLRDLGFSLYGHGPMWFERRKAESRLARSDAPSRALSELSWRRYYSLRNLVRILRDQGATGAAWRVSFLAGIAKPCANLPREPVHAMRHLAVNGRAIRDALTRRMGRTVEPTP